MTQNRKGPAVRGLFYFVSFASSCFFFLKGRFLLRWRRQGFKQMPKPFIKGGGPKNVS